MYSKDLEDLIEAVIADGRVTEQERKVLRKRAETCGEDPEEVLVYVEGLLARQESTKAPQKEKQGNIVKCPNCGIELVSGQLVCPECGYEFRNVRANSTREKFLAGLKEIQKNKTTGLIGSFLEGLEVTDSKLDNYIRNFPVPSSVEDLLEMLALCKSNLNSPDEKTYTAYKVLFNNCLEKVKQCGAENDSRFVPYLKVLKKKKNSERWGNFKAIIIALLIFGGLGFACYLGISSANKTEEKTENSISSQLDSLNQLIEDLPAPTAENYQECALAVQHVVWTPVNCDGKTSLEQLQQDAINSFVNKKNGYISLLNSLNLGVTLNEDKAENYLKKEEQDPRTTEEKVDKQYESLKAQLENLPDVDNENYEDVAKTLVSLCWKPITSEAETEKQIFTSPTDDEKYERSIKKNWYQDVKDYAGKMLKYYNDNKEELLYVDASEIRELSLNGYIE